MENDDLKNELAVLKADVAEIKQLVRELYNVLMPALKIKNTLTRKRKRN